MTDVVCSRNIVSKSKRLALLNTYFVDDALDNKSGNGFKILLDLILNQRISTVSWVLIYKEWVLWPR